MENIKEKIDEVVNKVKNNPDFAKKFQEEPVKALEEVMGVDLPDDKINEVVNVVKTKVNLDNSGIMGKVKGLFN
ncbi:MAG: hypothetical protein J6A89_08590 [Clostridia bacterium]|nr:hypothetical protein [Clostridia bacterium]